MATKPNSTLRLINKIQSLPAPQFVRNAITTLVFGANIRYAGTTAIGIQRLQEDSAIVNLKNRFHIQNHLGGVHATAMATLAESTTGMMFACNVPDTHIPLMKSMKIDYVARANGNLQAVASLTAEQRHEIRTTEKGSVNVPVTITDSKGGEPVICEMEWAWTPKRK